MHVQNKGTCHHAQLCDSLMCLIFYFNLIFFGINEVSGFRNILYCVSSNSIKYEIVNYYRVSFVTGAPRI